MVIRQNKLLIQVVALVLTGIKFRLSWGLYGPDAFRFSSEARAQESGADRRERQTCSQFALQAQAQAELVEGSSDPLGLEPDALKH